MSSPAPHRYAFGEFRVDAIARQLTRPDGTPIALTPRAFDTLLYLVRHAGVLLGKDELMAALWPGRIVEENNLSQSISTLRKALGTNGDGERYIVTEPGRGYRFAADVRTALEEAVTQIPSAGTVAALDGVVDPAPASPDRRPATTRHMRWITLAVALLIGLLAASAWWTVRHGSQATAVPITTIAILPFRPLSADDRDEVLELGMADTLIAKLGSSRRLVVRSLGSVRKFDGLDQDPLAAGRALNVGAVLEGHVQRRADHVHLTARLLRVTDGAALWGATFDEDFTDVFALQDAIAEKVATALSLALDDGEQRAMRAGYTRNTDAYMLYLQGRYRVGKTTQEQIRAGMAFFRKAIDLDPTFALAYAELADAYQVLPMSSDADPKDAFPLARAAAQKALQIDDDLAEAHTVLGWTAFSYDWDWAAAEKEFRRAIQLNPGGAEAHLGYGQLLSNTGRDAEAAEQGRLARELDPLSPFVNAVSAGFFGGAHRDQEARAVLNKALEIDPDFWIAHGMLGGAALGEKNYPVAIAEFTRSLEHSDGSMQAVSMLGYAKALAGDRDGAQALLDSLLQQVGQRHVPAIAVATIYVGLGDREQAIAWLDRAYDQRDPRMTYLNVMGRWNPLRTDPRFMAIMQRMNFTKR
jgi:DNA-binding winged helix-turn-helix (wHTH) protein/TolB-like protein/Tfp pilus assembly protein PilF